MRTEVALAAVPFLSVVRPSLALSTLKAALLQRNIESRVHYLNFDFAESIGIEFSEWIAVTSECTWLLGEWMFSSALDPSVDGTAYAGTVLSGLPKEFIGRLFDARHQTHLFVERSAERILSEGPAIIGLSTSFQQNCASLAIAREIKRRDPRVAICFGGANCDGEMGRALLKSFPQVDFVFSGEADCTFPEFVSEYLANNTRLCGGGERYRRFVTCVPAEDLDELPVPDFSDYFEQLAATTFRDAVHPGLLFEGSRGCWWGAKHRCKFCSLDGPGVAYRRKTSGRMLNELAELHAKYGLSRLEAVDKILDQTHLAGVFEELRTAGSSYRFFYEVKSSLTQEELAILAGGGVTWIQPGIESFSDHTLNLVDKGVTGLQSIRLLRACMEIGVRPVWNFLFGFPGEQAADYESAARLVPLLEHFCPPEGCCKMRLERFSPYFEQALDPGFRDVRPVAAYDHIYAHPAERVRSLAYYFEGIPTAIPAGEYMAGLRAALSQWREKFFSDADRPVLVLLQIGERLLVKDTRSCANQTWRRLSQTEFIVLSAFRDPRNVRATLANLEAEGVSDPDKTADRLL
ncbi:MAG: RiPP maturation radical SAM C-methyltransferase, partial [Acidobacteria bacterium]|nr:RiPP maturation radical SAM C-methyltransferase [Acidobacteriota bacterium]